MVVFLFLEIKSGEDQAVWFRFEVIGCPGCLSPQSLSSWSGVPELPKAYQPSSWILPPALCRGPCPSSFRQRPPRCWPFELQNFTHVSNVGIKVSQMVGDRIAPRVD